MQLQVNCFPVHHKGKEVIFDPATAVAMSQARIRKSKLNTFKAHTLRACTQVTASSSKRFAANSSKSSPILPSERLLAMTYSGYANRKLIASEFDE